MPDQKILWAAGFVALVGTLVYGHFRSTPYFAVWAWISFIGMVVCEEAFTRREPEKLRSRLPDITLLAAIIVFRKHPEVTVLVALAAGAAAGAVLREHWPNQVSRTASWILAAVAGSVTFGVVGFADTPHFVASIVVLIAWFALIQCWGRLSRRLVLVSIGSGVLGSLLALAWRTPGWTDALVLRMGQICVLAAAGMLLGALLGGSSQPIGVLRNPTWRRLPPALAIGFLLLVASAVAPDQASWMVAALGLLIVIGWVLTRRAFGPVVILVGGLLNEIVRGANNGKMPVDVSHLTPAMRAEFIVVAQTSAGYMLANAHSGLLFLADRYAAAPYPGVASLGDLTMAAGIIWWFAGTPGIPHRAIETRPQPAVAA